MERNDSSDFTALDRKEKRSSQKLFLFQISFEFDCLLFAVAMGIEDDFAGQGSLAIAKEDSGQVRHNVSISCNKQNESKGEYYLSHGLT